jgi:hypothetical protein
MWHSAHQDPSPSSHTAVTQKQGPITLANDDDLIVRGYDFGCEGSLFDHPDSQASRPTQARSLRQVVDR